MNSANFTIGSAGYYTEQRPFKRPNDPILALVQGNSARDREITSEIMRGLERDGSLSHYAKRIQVGTVRGQTTLRGRVEDAEGKDRIEKIAVRAAGRENVASLLYIQPQTGRIADRD